MLIAGYYALFMIYFEVLHPEMSYPIQLGLSFLFGVICNLVEREIEKKS